MHLPEVEKNIRIVVVSSIDMNYFISYLCLQSTSYITKKNKFKESLKIIAINTKITPVPQEVEIVKDNKMLSFFILP